MVGQYNVIFDSHFTKLLDWLQSILQGKKNISKKLPSKIL